MNKRTGTDDPGRLSRLIGQEPEPKKQKVHDPLEWQPLMFEDQAERFRALLQCQKEIDHISLRWGRLSTKVSLDERADLCVEKDLVVAKMIPLAEDLIAEITASAIQHILQECPNVEPSWFNKTV